MTARRDTEASASKHGEPVCGGATRLRRRGTVGLAHGTLKSISSRRHPGTASAAGRGGERVRCAWATGTHLGMTGRVG